MNEQIDYLRQLEQQSEQNHTEELYLWPRTPISNLQAEAWQRVGVSDWRADDPRSRPAQIVKVINNLLYNWLIPESFSIVDICCGDALILWHLKRKYPMSLCCGVDLNAGRQETHPMVSDSGVRLFRVPIQRLFKNSTSVLFDVAIMLNTYRGWEAAQLHDDEKWIVAECQHWLRQHAKFTILTCTDDQWVALRDQGFWVTTIGKGEDDSNMVLIFPCDCGQLEGLWNQRRP
ncbi:MAG: hypothetical protein ACW99G_17080 [Candidatus Thorarchaeota archaeon]|jgi:hypothetical protein